MEATSTWVVGGLRTVLTTITESGLGCCRIGTKTDLGGSVETVRLVVSFTPWEGEDLVGCRGPVRYGNVM